MSKVLVTGGTGTLGSEIVPRLLTADHEVRVMSRGPRKGSGKTEWAQANLADGTGLAEAVQGIDAIIHAASTPMGTKVDIDGTRILLHHAKEAGVSHFVYISIVGIDKIKFSYYRSKLAAEHLIEGGGVPWTILRAVQFHDLVDKLLQIMTRPPVALIPGGWQFQSMSEGEAAEQLIAAMEAGPSERLPDIGGPEVLSLNDMARTWMAAKGKQRPIVNLPIPGGLSKGIRQGWNTIPGNRVGKVTWADWVTARYAASGKVSAHQRAEEHPA